MWKALVRKELRENAGIAAAGLLAMTVITGLAMRLPLLPIIAIDYWDYELPFVHDAFEVRYLVVAAGLAMALGFHQSLGDARGSVYLFVLHRPLSRSKLIAAKLLVGVTLFEILTIGPWLAYALWAATPGTHASPFAWSMTLPVLIEGQALIGLYFGAFLSGLRPARWFGLRLAPLVTATAIVVLQVVVVQASPNNLWLVLVCCVVAVVVLSSVILSVSQSRDYA